MSATANTINPVIFEGSYIRVLRAGNRGNEMLQLAEFMDKYSELGFRVVQSFYENKGAFPAEGSLTVIMEYDQQYMDACGHNAARERGH